MSDTVPLLTHVLVQEGFLEKAFLFSDFIFEIKKIQSPILLMILRGGVSRVCTEESFIVK